MKTLWFMGLPLLFCAALIATVMVIGHAKPADAQVMVCGMRPMPPLGCTNGQAICTSQGWVWICN